MRVLCRVLAPGDSPTVRSTRHWLWEAPSTHQDLDSTPVVTPNSAWHQGGPASATSCLQGSRVPWDAGEEHWPPWVQHCVPPPHPGCWPCAQKSSLEKGMDELALPRPQWPPEAGWVARSRQPSLFLTSTWIYHDCPDSVPRLWMSPGRSSVLWSPLHHACPLGLLKSKSWGLKLKA